jgi:hypothetical protein
MSDASSTCAASSNCGCGASLLVAASSDSVGQLAASKHLPAMGQRRCVVSCYQIICPLTDLKKDNFNLNLKIDLLGVLMLQVHNSLGQL